MDTTPVPEYAGRRVAVYVAAVLLAYGTTCHLCGKPGADSADHVIPRSVDRSLTWDISNGRPAHRLCNTRRQAMPLDEWFTRHPLPVTRTPRPPSRKW